MTTLLSWISVDNRGPSCVYVAADSRITWESAAKRWDSGRKLFACRSADIFGYCGDVLYPSLVLGQLGDLIDRQVLWNKACDAQARHATIVEYLQTSFNRRHDAPDHDFTIVHCARDGTGLSSAFRIWTTNYKAKGKVWRDNEITLDTPRGSKVVLTLGSGSNSLNEEIRRWDDSPQGGTARAIFAAFCDSLASNVDPRTGGMPQIVALDRRNGGKVVGFVSEGVRYLHGLPIQPLPELESIEWVDALFQRISPETLARLSNAQIHTRVEHPHPGGFAAFLKRTSQ